MSLLLRFLDSSLGRKVLMSLTGLFLCTFLIVHVSGNLQLFHNDQGLAFNQYSVFMTTFFPIKVISYLLYISIILHVVSGIRLTLKNRQARPVGYSAPKDPRSSTFASKNMALLGMIVLIFLVTHLANFWYKYKFGETPWSEYRVDVSTGELVSPKTEYMADSRTVPFEQIVSEPGQPIVKSVVVKDLYRVVEEAFRIPWLVVLYLIGLIALAYHLVHGFQSGFQSLGLRHPAYTPLIKGVGIWIFGIIIPLLFAAMPVYFFFLK
jgi:succinate dehydrogenase / fumarate reductase, cytochrome b subunit